MDSDAKKPGDPERQGELFPEDSDLEQKIEESLSDNEKIGEHPEDKEPSPPEMSGENAGDESYPEKPPLHDDLYEDQYLEGDEPAAGDETVMGTEDEKSSDKDVDRSDESGVEDRSVSGGGGDAPPRGEESEAPTSEEPEEEGKKKRKKKRKGKKYDPREMPFLDHLEEFRWRIIKTIVAVVIGMIFCFGFSDLFVEFLKLPFDQVQAKLPLEEQAKLQFLTPTGPFMLKIYVALAAGFILVLPVVLYQIWAFVAPGLLRKERGLVFPILALTMVCFLAGGSMAYFVVIPLAIEFLQQMATPGIPVNPNIMEYMKFVIRLLIVFGLMFELPVVTLLLAKIGIVTPKFLRRYRSYAIILIFIAAAFLTPPDPFTQMAMAVPLILLYEVSILFAWIASRKKSEED